MEPASISTKLKVPATLKSITSTVGVVIWQLEPEWVGRENDPVVSDKFAALRDILTDFYEPDSKTEHGLLVYTVASEPGTVVMITPLESPEKHTEQFERSESIRDIMQEFGGYAHLRSSIYVHASWDDVRNVLGGETGLFGRWWVRPGEEGRFESEGWPGVLARAETTRGGKIIGAPRVVGFGGDELDDEDDSGGQNVDDGEGDGAQAMEWLAFGEWQNEAAQTTFVGRSRTLSGQGAQGHSSPEAEHLCRRVHWYELRQLEVKYMDDGFSEGRSSSLGSDF